jgi:peptidoglycan/LPS O-acetylase OafA/YrhL
MAPRSLTIDGLKVLASQLIVLHHIVLYAPMAFVLAGWPALQDFLAGEARYMVQVFLVIGGYLAAQSLARGQAPLGRLLWQRYLRLVPMLALALLAVLAATALLPPGRWPDWVTPWPSVLQFVAHLLLLQDLLGIPALSAGVWYVAIDFQLYALLVLLLWLSRRLPGTDFAGALAVLVLAAASLFWFNRDPRWDATGLYFFGAYALGVLSGWAIRSERRAGMLLLLGGLGGAALLVDFRPRIAIALAIALTLDLGRPLLSRFEMRLVHYLGGTSYALFLVHFPVLLVVSAVFEHYRPGDPLISTLGLFVAWLASMLAADRFHRRVELPLLHWQKRRFLCRSKRNAAGASGAPAPRAY